jgi:peptide/nickel transport system substrate-binding protein
MSDQLFCRHLSRRQLLEVTLVTFGAGASGLLLAACNASPPVPTPAAAPAAPTTAPAPTTVSSAPTAATSAPTATVAATPAAAAQATVTGTQPQRGGTLITARSVQIPSLDPQLEATEGRVRLSVLLYNGLVRMDDQSKIVPDLAASWDTPDPTTYIFTLRQGVKWHNGRELVADDVKYTLDRLLDEKVGSAGRAEFTPIKSVETPDKYTVKITTSAPFAALLTSLAGKYGAIVPQEAIKQYGDLKKNVVGTGPFMLEEWVPQSHAKLKRNPSYFREGLPYLDGIEWQIVPDESNIVAGLRGATIHHSAIEDRTLATVLKAEPNLTVSTLPTLATDSVWMNTTVAPLGVTQVRQAISLAIDRPAIIQAAVAGYGVLSGPMPPSSTLYALPASELQQLYARDVAKAKSLLKDGGFPNGFKLDLWTISGYSALAAAAQVIAANLKEVGIDAQIQTVESGVWITKFTGGQFPASMNTGGGLLDPDIWFRYMHSAPAGKDWQNLKDPALDVLLEKGRTTIDPSQRSEIYKEFQRTAITKGSIIILYAPVAVDVTQNTVKGFTQHPTGWSYGFETTWLEKK